MAKKNRFLYQKNKTTTTTTKKITLILIVKILDFSCVRNYWQEIIMYMVSLFYISLDFH